MQLHKLLFIIFSTLYSLSYSQSKNIELPIIAKDGYGPFSPNMSGMQPYSYDKENPWKNTQLEVIGLPAVLTNIKIGAISTDKHQQTYQNYNSGKITKKWYETVQNGWGWTPDTSRLSKKSIKTEIAFAFGENTDGEIKMIIDANNNLDFSDDSIFSPILLETFFKEKDDIDSLIRKHKLLVTYEKVFENEIIQNIVPLLVTFNKDMNMFFYNFPLHFTTDFKGKEIAIFSDEFSSPSFNKTTLTLASEDSNNNKLILTSNDEFININDSLYLNKGVDPNKNVLILEQVETTQNHIESTTVGFKSIPFEGEDFKTKKIIKSENYKGKYLLLEFWGTWCSPCIEELPNFKEIYDEVDKSKFEIIGIVFNSPKDDLVKIIQEYSINWPQIITNKNNPISESYKVDGYPTTYLINPKGIIIEKNLRGPALKKRIKELVNQE